MTRYSDLRDALIESRSGFESLGFRFAPLKHDFIWAPEFDRWTVEEYEAFRIANTAIDGAGSEMWELWPNGNACGRFWGQWFSAERVRDFKQLASQAYRILDEIATLRSRDEAVRDRTEAKLTNLRKTGGCFKEHADLHWLELLHEGGVRYPTSRLSASLRLWNYVGPDLCDDGYQAVGQEMVTPRGGSAAYHAHPLSSSLEVDVFQASAEFISLCLQPCEVVEVGQWDGGREIILPEPLTTPVWDGTRLSYGDRLIKKFTKPAENQKFVLDQFELASWPQQIRNPFVSKKMAIFNADDALKNTIDALNDAHVSKGILRFGTKGSLFFAKWEPLDS